MYTLYSLPNEVLQQVFSDYLSPVDLLRVAGVSKDVRGTIIEDHTFWNMLIRRDLTTNLKSSLLLNNDPRQSYYRTFSGLNTIPNEIDRIVTAAELGCDIVVNSYLEHEKYVYDILGFYIADPPLETKIEQSLIKLTEKGSIQGVQIVRNWIRSHNQELVKRSLNLVDIFEKVAEAAIQHGRRDIFNYIQPEDPEVDVGPWPHDAVFLAAKHGQPEILNDLFAKNPPDEDAVANTLLNAVSYGQLSVVRSIMEGPYKIPVDTELDETNSTALHLAVQYGYPAIAEYLVSLGSDLDAEDEDGDTPLSIAYRQNHREVIVALGANPDD